MRRHLMVCIATLGGLLAFSTLVFGQDSLNVSRLAQLTHPSNPDYGRDVALTDIRAYICSGYPGLSMADISDPDSLIEMNGNCDICGARGITLDSSETYGYVARYGFGLTVAGISDPDTITRLGTYYPSPASAENVALLGHYAVLTVGTGGIRIINVENPNSLSQVGSLTTTGTTHGVAVQAPYAYTAGNNGLRVVDLTDPAQPVIVGSLPEVGYAMNVAVRDTFAFVVGVGFHIVNIADPAHPTLISTCTLPDTAWDVVLYEHIAYVADDLFGLRVIDIENTADPHEVGFYNSPGHAYGVAAHADRVYLADGLYFGLYLAQVDPLVRMESFNGGEVIGGGTAQSIEWSAVCLVGNVNIDVNYNYPGGEWVRLFSEVVPDSGSIAWTAAGPRSEHCRIRILSTNDPTVGDTSDADFTLIRGAISLYPSLISFGDVAAGESVTDYLHLRNTGADTLMVDSILTGEPIFSSLDSWPKPIAPGDSMDIAVRFSPSDLSGYYSQFILYTSAGDSLAELSGRGTAASSADPLSELPKEHRLYPAYPNPFNAVATISYDLPSAGHVSLRLFDALGRTAAVLTEGLMDAGNHRVTVDGTRLASGVYFARLEAGRYIQTTKLVLLK